ncbi:MAG: hypothetical protein RMJ55_07345 [Roseiflexaceae bacterium]|nr:hypothetical protein [Roseiflexus sp.]MDW8213354.1 hypothetical protein [Roseiflexaceae bacterium]
MFWQFFTPGMRYRVLRDAEEGLAAGEELTFLSISGGSDRYYGYYRYHVVFAEKDVYVDSRDDLPSELEQTPEQFLLPLGPADPLESMERLERRQVQERAALEERERAWMEAKIEKIRAKRRKKRK